MPLQREDLLPYYKEDLMEKAARVRKVIEGLPNFKIPEIGDVSPSDYELIKLAIINSIKGEQVAKEEKTRQDFVEQVFLKPAKDAQLLDYQDTSKTSKCDFEGHLQDGTLFGLEVKGGEGNSLTQLQRPRHAQTFAVWSHLDVMSNTPGENMQKVLARIVKQMINEDEKRQKVDFLMFYDEWYRTGVKVFRTGNPLPDVFIFPEATPTKQNTHPSLPQADNILLNAIMKVVGNIELSSSSAKRHLWWCDIRLLQEGTRWMRRMKVFNEFDRNVTLTKQEYTSAVCKPL